MKRYSYTSFFFIYHGDEHSTVGADIESGLWPTAIGDFLLMESNVHLPMDTTSTAMKPSRVERFTIIPLSIVIVGAIFFKKRLNC